MLYFLDKDGNLVDMNDPNAFVASIFNPNAPKRKKLTVEQKQKIWSYCCSKEEGLFDVYGRPSEAKQTAWWNIQREFEQLGGRSLRITGHCVNHFSAGFKYTKDGEDYLRYYTKSKTVDILWDQDQVSREVFNN